MNKEEKWNAFDKALLRQLVEERISIIENRTSEASDIKRKAWEEISKSFNMRVLTNSKTIDQLREKWHSIKIGRALTYNKRIDVRGVGQKPSSPESEHTIKKPGELDKIQEQNQPAMNGIQNTNFPTVSFGKPDSSPIINPPMCKRHEANIERGINGWFPEGFTHKFDYKTPNRSSEIKSSLQSDSISPRNETVVKPTKQISASDSGNFNDPSSDTFTATILAINNNLEMPTIDLTDDNESEFVASNKSGALSQRNNVSTKLKGRSSFERSKQTNKEVRNNSLITNYFIKMEKDEEQRRVEERESQQPTFRRNSSLITEEQLIETPSSNIGVDHRKLQSSNELTESYRRCSFLNSNDDEYSGKIRNLDEQVNKIKNFAEQKLKQRSLAKSPTEAVVKPTHSKQGSAFDSGNFLLKSPDSGIMEQEIKGDIQHPYSTLLDNNNVLKMPTKDLTNDNESEFVASNKSGALSQRNSAASRQSNEVAEIYSPITHMFLKMEEDEEQRRIEEQECQEPTLRQISSLITEKQPIEKPSSNNALNVGEAHQKLQNSNELTESYRRCSFLNCNYGEESGKIKNISKTDKAVKQMKNSEEQKLKHQSATKTRAETVVKPTDSKQISFASDWNGLTINSMSRIKKEPIEDDGYGSVSGLIENNSNSEIIDLTSESECDSSEKSVNISQNNNVEAEELERKRRPIDQQGNPSTALEAIAHTDNIEEQRLNNLKKRETKQDTRPRQVTVLSPTVIKITSSTAEGSFQSNICDKNQTTYKQRTEEQIMPSTDNESEDLSTESIKNSSPMTSKGIEVFKSLLSQQEFSPGLVDEVIECLNAIKRNLSKKTSTIIEIADKNKHVGKSSPLETILTKHNEEQCTSEIEKAGEKQDTRPVINSSVFVEEHLKEITRRDPSCYNVEEQLNSLNIRENVLYDSLLKKASTYKRVQEQPKITTRRETITGCSSEQPKETNKPKSSLKRVEEQPKEITRRDSSLNNVEEQSTKITGGGRKVRFNSVFDRVEERPKITTRRTTITGRDCVSNRVEEQLNEINRRHFTFNRVEDQSKIVTRRNSVLKSLDKQQKTINKQEYATKIAEEEPKEITRKDSALILAERPRRNTEEKQNSESIQKPKRKYIRKKKTETVTPDQSQLDVRNLNIPGSSSLQNRRSSLFKQIEEQPKTMNKQGSAMKMVEEQPKEITQRPKITTRRTTITGRDSVSHRVEEQPKITTRRKTVTGRDSFLNREQSNEINRRDFTFNRVEDQPKIVTRRNSALKKIEEQPKARNKQGSSMKKPTEDFFAERPTQTDNTVFKCPRKYRKSFKNEEQVAKPKKRKYTRKKKVETVTSDQLHLVEPNFNVPASSSPHLHALLQPGLEREIMARQTNASEANLLKRNTSIERASETQNKRPRQEKSTQGSNLDRNKEQKQKNARRLAAKAYGKVLLIRKKRRRCSNKNDTETVTTEESHLILPTLNAPEPSIDSIRLAQCPECIGSTRTLNTTDGTTPDFFALYETVRKLKVYIFKVQSLGMKQMSFIGSQVNEPQSLFYNSFERVDNLLINKYRERLHVYDETKFQDNKPFFGLYSQSCRPHLCDTRKISIIRKSEFHSKVNNIKQHPKKKKKLKQTVNVIIYSFEDDLYLDLPQNDFWTKPNVTLRLKKSINNNFNFIYASRIALADVKIYGSYFVEYVYMGRALEGEWEINYDSKPFPIDCGFLHYGDGNNKLGDEMAIACAIVDKFFAKQMPRMRS